LPSVLWEPQLYVRNQISVKRLRRLAEVGAQQGEAPA
jgi:hypothetical protein